MEFLIFWRGGPKTQFRLIVIHLCASDMRRYRRDIFLVLTLSATGLLAVLANLSPAEAHFEVDNPYIWDCSSGTYCYLKDPHNVIFGGNGGTANPLVHRNHHPGCDDQ